MNPDEINRLLGETAERVDTGNGRDIVERAERTLLLDLQPVKQIAPGWQYTIAFLAVFIVLSTSAATALGLHGFHALNAMQLALILSALLAISWYASIACVREMGPAAGSRIGSLALGLSVAGLLVLFSLIFHSYSLQHFVPEGVPCLLAGLAVSLPTGLVLAAVLRRGFVMDWSAAGVSAGTLAGLTGLGMLELHCPNLKAIHVMVWHVAVVVVSGALGFIAGTMADAFRRSRIAA